MHGPDEPRPVRVITDVETMRALSDPTRVAILRLLMSGDRSAPPVMSAKELAAALGEPQTKLYRHLKQLEALNLIEVGETRLVSGIQEQRYRTAQLDFSISRDLVTNGGSAEFADTLTALFSEFRTDLLSGLRAGRVPVGTAAETPLGLVLGRGMVARVSPTRAAEFRRRLVALQAEFDALEDDDPTGIPVHLLIGWYAVTDPD
ncbi:winged helix-turn-helix domain-containing protein [Kribbella sp. NBC_01505]|uniref:ArsR/SmtB family transcription factor n=1 Tax=Kribbella sp. NBC_01505 TaxID=2903580 RepID=UPI003869D9AD